MLLNTDDKTNIMVIIFYFTNDSFEIMKANPLKNSFTPFTGLESYNFC